MDIKATKEWWAGICVAGSMTPDEAATLVHTVDDLIAEVERLKKIEVAARAIADNAEECEFNDMMSFAASLDYLADLNGVLDDSEVERLEAEGHTEHCAARHVWGDGQCECQKKGIIPGPVSQLVIDAVHPPILCESCQQMKFPACPYPYARGSAVECNCFTQAEAVLPPAPATTDRHEWKTGFVCGYVCAAANVVRTHDLPTVALDLLKEGIGKEDISVVDESDLETLVNSDSRIAAYLHRDQLSEAAEAVRP